MFAFITHAYRDVLSEYYKNVSLIRDAMRLTDPSVYMYDADTTEHLSGMLYDDRAI